MLSIFSCVCWPSVCLLWRNVCLYLWPVRLQPERDKAATTGEPILTLMGSLSSALGCRGWQEAESDWGVLALVGVSPSACRSKGWHMGRESMMAAPPFACLSTVVPHFQGRSASSRIIPGNSSLLFLRPSL